MLITRPEPQASRFAAELRDGLGDMVEPVLSPLMAPQRLDPALPPASALVLTSESAVPAARGGLPALAYCVGDRTAAAARQAGFQTVSARGDAAALAALILERGTPGPLLWLRGEEVAGDLAGLMAAGGVEVHQAVVYRQAPQPLSAETARLLRGPGPVIVPLFSPRSAVLFAAAAAGARAPLHLCALSPAVAAAAADLPRASLRVADRPDGKALLESVSLAIRAVLSA